MTPGTAGDHGTPSLVKTVAVAIAAMAAFCGAAPGRVSSPPPAEVDLSLIPNSARIGSALATGGQSSDNVMEALLQRTTTEGAALEELDDKLEELLPGGLLSICQLLFRGLCWHSLRLRQSPSE